MAGDIDFLRELEAFLAELDWVQVSYARIAQDGAVDLGVVTDQRARLHVDLVARFGAGRVNLAAQRPEDRGPLGVRQRRDHGLFGSGAPRRPIDQLQFAAEAAFMQSEWAGVVELDEARWEVLVTRAGLGERVDRVASEAGLAGSVTARVVPRSYEDLERLKTWAQRDGPRVLRATCHTSWVDIAHNEVCLAIVEDEPHPDDLRAAPDGIRLVPGRPMPHAV